MDPDRRCGFAEVELVVTGDRQFRGSSTHRSRCASSAGVRGSIGTLAAGDPFGGLERGVAGRRDGLLAATSPARVPRLIRSLTAGRAPRSDSRARSAPRTDHAIGRFTIRTATPVAACSGCGAAPPGAAEASSASTVLSQSTVAECAVMSRSASFWTSGLAATASAFT